jgi:hypothetical protein
MPRPASTPLLAPVPVVPASAPAGTVAPAAAPCHGQLREGPVNGLAVLPGTGSAVVSWNNAGDATVSAYRVGALTQDLVRGSQPVPTWVTVPPGTGCGRVSATLSGLRSGGLYRFVLDAVANVPSARGPREMAIGQSGVVQIG